MFSLFMKCKEPITTFLIILQTATYTTIGHGTDTELQPNTNWKIIRVASRLYYNLGNVKIWNNNTIDSLALLFGFSL